MRSKAFFVNGGYGRMLCSIPAFELYNEESDDKDFIIVCEGGTDAFKGHPVLDNHVYDSWHKNLFREKSKIFVRVDIIRLITIIWILLVIKFKIRSIPITSRTLIR